MSDAPLWRPDAARAARSQWRAFETAFRAETGVAPDERSLWELSVADPAAFWRTFWDFAGVIGDPGATTVRDLDAMPGARFFPDATLNFAENLLQGEGPHGEDSAPALIFRDESGARDVWTWDDLRSAVAALQTQFAAWGVEPGDRVAALMPNRPETVAAFLAAASLGAVWSSTSPDFGADGVLDRFGQIGPKVLIVCDGYRYGGKTFEIGEKVRRIVGALPCVERVIVVPVLGSGLRLDGAESWERVCASVTGKAVFARFAFNHPLAILFSSGTTGKPKCIVHGAGGTLLQHLKEHRLHCDLRPGERFFYFTTCGWMMWNWLISGLASRATLVLFDGNPAHPNPLALFRLAAEEAISVFGVSAKFIDAVRQSGARPKEAYDLSALRLVLSTGSPLSGDGFDFVYEAIAPSAQLASISGGTDIVSCFVLGNPVSPVWRGEIQGPGLGMAVDVADADGASLPPGKKGELVCRNAFPSMPLGFWGDEDGSLYRAAYFERFEGTWHHGDFAERTERGGFVIHGRSDATLNPGGVRIGTAEIYAQAEAVEGVQEALAIAQDWEGDQRIVLFVVLAEGHTLDEALESDIRKRIREGASPRHVPSVIAAVPDLPRTRSGKITEIAVREAVHGRDVTNAEALANPDVLAYFKKVAALRP